MEAVVTRVLPLHYNEYFKCFQYRFHARCPRCNSLNKHGQAFAQFTASPVVQTSRACDKCGKDYVCIFKS